MNLKIIISTILILSSVKILSQKKLQPIYFLDYTYANRHLAKGGFEFILIKNERKQNNLFLGIGYGMVNYDGKIRGIPDLHLSYNIGSLLFIKAGSSSYHAYSLTGISGFNLVDLGIGYSYPYKNSPVKIQGLTVGITFRITKRDDVYGKLKIGF